LVGDLALARDQAEADRTPLRIGDGMYFRGKPPRDRARQ
jgi:hypothetical protein